jgi:hypothetical protein
MSIQIRKKNVNMLPYELVDLIADYHDYDKYCKPEHMQKYNSVLENIIDMGNIMHTISPNIALQCWGSKAHLLGPTSYEFTQEEFINIYDILEYEELGNLEFVDNENMVGLYNDDGEDYYYSEDENY